MARPKAPTLGETAYEVSAEDAEIVSRLRKLIVQSLKEIERDNHKVRNEYQQSMRVAAVAKLNAEMRAFIKTCARVVAVTAETETDPAAVRSDVIGYLRVLGPEEGTVLYLEAYGRAPEVPVAQPRESEPEEPPDSRPGMLYTPPMDDYEPEPEHA